MFFRINAMMGSMATAMALALVQASLALATEIPNCPEYALRSQNGGDPGSLGINNDDVLKWKATSANQYHDRGHVQGKIVRVYPDKNGHEHFAIQIGSREDETLEIIYNQHFGYMPAPAVGMEVEACGDYITSIAPSPGPGGVTYPASPDGAILHWVHMAPPRSGHHSGFVVIDGVLTGQDYGNAPPRSARPKKRKHPHFH